MPPRARGRRGRGGSSSRGGSDRAPASAEPQEVGETIAQNESSTSPSASDEDRVATASDPTPITIHGEKYYRQKIWQGSGKVERRLHRFGNMALKLSM